MDAFKLFTSGGQSTIDDFARNASIKCNLTTKLEDTAKEIIDEFFRINESNSDLNQFDNSELTINDVTIKCINEFLIILESIILHGLKEKLSFSKVLSPVKFGYDNSSNRFTIQSSKNVNYYPDFWPVILILNHNQVNLSLKNLNNINTDIGKCRAWIRLALNDGLLTSYLRALTNDTSLLHGFYKPSAYLRDRDHIDRLFKIIGRLDIIRFNLNYDYKSLNSWNRDSLILIGFNVDKIPLEDDDEALKPVMPGIDALDLLNENDFDNDEDFIVKKESDLIADKSNITLESSSNDLNFETSSMQIKTGWSTSPPPLIKQNLSNDDEDDEQLNRNSNANKKNNILSNNLSQLSTKSHSTINQTNNKTIKPINKLTTTIKPTSSKSIKINAKPQYNHKLDDCSYDSLLQSYSSEVNLLCSTPEIRDIYMPQSSNDSLINKKSKDKTQDPISDNKMKFGQQENNYEIIPQSLVLDNSDQSTQHFLSKFFKIQIEIGLDKQDYKCNKCARPIGMVYGKSRLCKYDGLHYCLDCHQDDKAIIPARVLYNWDFNKYSISKDNKEKLELIENEPLINIKLKNPLLYQFNSIMKECLQLRTQLFYLHAYLFTCQESVALDLRKQVWPSEHLFEHIHLYSLNDLQQAQNGNLFTNLKKSINLAKKHVVNCALCSQKGFICEICSNPKIIYPFDVEDTYRCEQCKSVYHLNCIVLNSQHTSSNNSNVKVKTKIKPCPRCLRIRCREEIQKIRMT